MKAKIIILSYLKYTKKNKETGVEKPMTMVSYLMADPQETNKFVGFTPIQGFYEGHEVFSKFSKGLLLRPIDATFDVKDDYYDPSKLRKILVKINDISLV